MNSAITDITGIGPAAATALAEHGFTSLKSIATTTVEKLSAVPGFSEARAAKVIVSAAELLPEEIKSGKDKDKKKAKKDKKGKKGKDKKKDKKDKKGKKGKGKK